MRVPAGFASTPCTCVSPELLSKILKPLEHKYYELGVQLDVGTNQLKDIEGRHQGNSCRFIEMIKSWQNISANCSWSALANGVERVEGYDNLVRGLRAVAAIASGLTGVARFLIMSPCIHAAPTYKLSEIVYALKPLAHKYYELGVQLDVGTNQLKEIERQYQGSCSRCFIEVIESWQNMSANCSWSALADGVERVGGYDNLMKELRARDDYCYNHHPQCIPELIHFTGPLATLIFQRFDWAFYEALSACNTESVMSATETILSMNVCLDYKYISCVYRAKCKAHREGQLKEALSDCDQVRELANSLECENGLLIIGRALTMKASILRWSKRLDEAKECVDRAKEKLAGLAAASSDTAAVLYEEVRMKICMDMSEGKDIKVYISQVEELYDKIFNHKPKLHDSQLCSYVNARAEVYLRTYYLDDNLPFSAIPIPTDSDLCRAEEILNLHPLRNELPTEPKEILNLHPLQSKLPTEPHGNRGWYYRNIGDLCMWRKQYSKAIEWAKKAQDQFNCANMKHVLTNPEKRIELYQRLLRKLRGAIRYHHRRRRRYHHRCLRRCHHQRLPRYHRRRRRRLHH